MGAEVMAGLEYGTARDHELIDGEPHVRAAMNIIMAIPSDIDTPVVIEKGAPLAWIFTLPKKQRMESV
ncbi:hypothetical protein [Streptomyces sp. NPDC005423]|uniref:hypothetical protein n=1 Tax=Streptomyces sp. NPDC005423 TaxID=3155343 RepID=UPI0033A7A72A